MKSVLLTTALIAILVFPACAQFDMLGKNLVQICTKIDNDPEYESVIDTVDSHTILVLCKGADKYPYYSYEIDRVRDECVCVGIVSRNREVFDAYVNVFSALGTIVEQDSAMVNFKYMILKTNDFGNSNHNEKLYLSVMQPYINSTLLSQRSIFSISLSKSNEYSSAAD
ncbi:MAG: hypothetical protein K6F33_08880 [Bacteroidales bacterium]|nr:hypothetical protein [Bacteroidales bacterium]